MSRMEVSPGGMQTLETLAKLLQVETLELIFPWLLVNQPRTALKFVLDNSNDLFGCILMEVQDTVQTANIDLSAVAAAMTQAIDLGIEIIALTKQNDVNVLKDTMTVIDLAERTFRKVQWYIYDLSKHDDVKIARQARKPHGPFMERLVDLDNFLQQCFLMRRDSGPRFIVNERKEWRTRLNALAEYDTALPHPTKTLGGSMSHFRRERKAINEFFTEYKDYVESADQDPDRQFARLSRPRHSASHPPPPPPPSLPIPTATSSTVTKSRNNSVRVLTPASDGGVIAETPDYTNDASASTTSVQSQQPASRKRRRGASGKCEAPVSTGSSGRSAHEVAEALGTWSDRKRRRNATIVTKPQEQSAAKYVKKEEENANEEGVNLGEAEQEGEEEEEEEEEVAVEQVAAAKEEEESQAEGEEEPGYEVGFIMSHEDGDNDGEIAFGVFWVGYGWADATVEPPAHLEGVELFDAYVEDNNLHKRVAATLGETSKQTAKRIARSQKASAKFKASGKGNSYLMSQEIAGNPKLSTKKKGKGKEKENRRRMHV